MAYWLYLCDLCSPFLLQYLLNAHFCWDFNFLFQVKVFLRIVFLFLSFNYSYSFKDLYLYLDYESYFSIPGLKLQVAFGSLSQLFAIEFNFITLPIIEIECSKIESHFRSQKITLIQSYSPFQMNFCNQYYAWIIWRKVTFLELKQFTTLYYSNELVAFLFAQDL